MQRRRLLAALGLLLAGGSQSPRLLAQSKPLTVVYWSARDCRWCTWWEGKIIGSGGEANFLASPEGKAVQYLTIKKTYLAIPYEADDFKPEQRWLWEQLQSGQHRRIAGYPSFSLFEGRDLVVYAVGQDGFQKELLPKLRERLQAR